MGPLLLPDCRFFWGAFRLRCAAEDLFVACAQTILLAAQLGLAASWNDLDLGSGYAGLIMQGPEVLALARGQVMPWGVVGSFEASKDPCSVPDVTCPSEVHRCCKAL